MFIKSLESTLERNFIYDNNLISASAQIILEYNSQPCFYVLILTIILAPYIIISKQIGCFALLRHTVLPGSLLIISLLIIIFLSSSQQILRASKLCLNFF